ncbi:hypothetical protein PsYK624_077380 [Phanerochaete sordida]|uniref:F-box domain-containing protein n=1 Tax=Phanerochaete sordida TaxID=48140 RepID=A0A9P3LEJ7_9APHY|nr:hypothetical protein PsYK624_077380 [Phanerochaete sordida]
MLPPELLDAVFGQLVLPQKGRQTTSYWDKENLSSCALVCHTWTALAQPYLFRHVSYALKHDSDEDSDEDWDEDWDEDLDEGEDLEEQCDARAALHNVLEFYVEHCHLAAHVRQLSLETVRTGGYGHSSRWIISPETGYQEPSVFMNTLQTFPRLQRLSLRDVFTTSPLGNPDRKPISLQSLTIVSEQDMIMPYRDVANLLTFFEEVDVLHIAVTSHPSEEHHVSQPIAVRNVTAKHPTSRSLFRSLALPPSAHCLQSLTLEKLNFALPAEIQRLLEATKSNLTRLSLSFGIFARDDRFWVDRNHESAPLCLASCHSLKSLELSVRVAGPPTWKDLWSILATLSPDTSRALEDITVVLRRPSRFVLDTAWALSDVATLHSTYATLSRLSDGASFRRFVVREMRVGRGWDDKEIFPEPLRSRLRALQ